MVFLARIQHGLPLFLFLRLRPLSMLFLLVFLGGLALLRLLRLRLLVVLLLSLFLVGTRAVAAAVAAAARSSASLIFVLAIRVLAISFISIRDGPRRATAAGGSVRDGQRGAAAARARGPPVTLATVPRRQLAGPAVPLGSARALGKDPGVRWSLVLSLAWPPRIPAHAPPTPENLATQGTEIKTVTHFSAQKVGGTTHGKLHRKRQAREQECAKSHEQRRATHAQTPMGLKVRTRPAHIGGLHTIA